MNNSSKSVRLFENFTYINELNNSLDGDNIDKLVESFVEYDKLSGDIDKDSKIIDTLYKYINENLESEDSSNIEGQEEEAFDPYSHLVQNDLIDEDKDCVLSFGDTNVKMKKLGIVYFSLPAGYTCPFADICKSFAHKTGGKFKSNDKSIKDDGEFRCYAASAEMQYPNTRELRWRNFDLLKDNDTNRESIKDLIGKSLKYYEYNNRKVSIMRIHESGDFYTQDYFDAWMDVASERGDILFYAYTKAIPYLIKRKGEMPKNFRIIASIGGKSDMLLKDHPEIRKAYVVDSEEEAMKRRLRIDINDFLAVGGADGEDFALLLHGTQPKESGKTNLGRANSALAKEKSKTFGTDKKLLQKIAQKYTT
jgi:hypothetical protein